MQIQATNALASKANNQYLSDALLFKPTFFHSLLSRLQSTCLQSVGVSDDVDQLGYSYTGGVSDDDHLSITSGASNASDGGLTISGVQWRHLSIAEQK